MLCCVFIFQWKRRKTIYAITIIYTYFLQLIIFCYISVSIILYNWNIIITKCHEHTFYIWTKLLCNIHSSQKTKFNIFLNYIKQPATKYSIILSGLPYNANKKNNINHSFVVCLCLALSGMFCNSLLKRRLVYYIN